MRRKGTTADSYDQLPEAVPLTSDQAILRVGGSHCFQCLLFVPVSLAVSLTGHFLYMIALYQDT